MDDENLINSSPSEQIFLLVKGMSCVACVNRVEQALHRVDQVQKVQVNLADNSALVWGNVNKQDLLNAVKNAGYSAEVIEDEASIRGKQQDQFKAELNRLHWQSFLAIGFGLGLMVFGFYFKSSMSNYPQGIILAIIVWLVMLVTGRGFYWRALQNLRHRTSSMDSLVAIGTLSAYVYSLVVIIAPTFFPPNSRHLYFDAGVMIIGLINLGKMLELKAKRKSSQALESLLNLTPPSVQVVTERGIEALPLEKVDVGMTIRLQVGERVPVDGIVVHGNAWVDESMLSGEPLAVAKHINSTVSAGTIVTDGTVLIKAEQVGKHTRLAQIINLVRLAQSTKPEIGQLVDKIIAVFVPAVLSIAVLSGVVWYISSENISYALMAFTSVLVIACPCALGLATPMSIIAGIARSAELGILVRNSDALQKANTADCVVFDKTGTLTEGNASIKAIHTFNNFSSEEVLRLSASLEQGSNHPLAQALLASAQSQKLILSFPHNFKNFAGLGISGDVENSHIALGNSKFIHQFGIDFTCAEEILTSPELKSASLVFCAINHQLAGVIVIYDQLRPSSFKSIEKLKASNLRCVMLTGDQKASALSVAEMLGVDEVYAELLPADKFRILQELQAKGRKIIMVGDGINDSPALAQAEVSIAMGDGSDIAIATADFTLLRPNLEAVADVLSLSRAVISNIKQNLFFAFIYNLICIPLATGVFYGYLGFMINPMWGAGAMMLSSFSVVLNANRLLRFKL